MVLLVQRDPPLVVSYPDPNIDCLSGIVNMEKTESGQIDTSIFIPHAGPTFIKPDQRNPWIKDQLWNDLLSTIFHLQLPNFVSCGRDKPSHMTQNLVTEGVKL